MAASSAVQMELQIISDQLSTLIESITEGFSELSYALEDLGGDLISVTNVTKAASSALSTAAVKMVALGGAIYGLAHAGLSGTTEGNKLSYAWTLLTRQIASIFLPVLDLVVSGILKLTEWFRGLSGEGQSIAMSIAMVSVGMKVLLPVLGMLKSLFSPIALVVGLVAEALIQFFTGTEEGRLLFEGLSAVMAIFTSIFAAFGEVFKVVVDAIVVAFQFIYRTFVMIAIGIAALVETILDWIPGLGDATRAVREWKENAIANLQNMDAKGFGADAKVNKDKQRREVNPTGFNFESLSASFERITSEANKKDLAKDSLETQKAQLEEQKRTNEQLARMGNNPQGGTGKDY